MNETTKTDRRFAIAQGHSKSWEVAKIWDDSAISLGETSSIAGTELDYKKLDKPNEPTKNWQATC